MKSIMTKCLRLIVCTIGIVITMHCFALNYHINYYEVNSTQSISQTVILKLTNHVSDQKIECLPLAHTQFTSIVSLYYEDILICIKTIIECFFFELML